MKRNFLNKREQSQARLSYAECEKSRLKAKLFSLLVLLVAAVTGAWADVAPTYDLTVGTNDHSTMKFYVGQDEVTKAKEGETVTIVVTPDDGWSIGNVTGQWIAAMAKAPRRTAGIGLLQDVDVTFVSEDAQTGAHTYTFVMQRAKAEFNVVYKKHLDHPDITISNILPVIYNAQAHTPSFTVKDGSKVLVLGTDYTVTVPSGLSILAISFPPRESIRTLTEPFPSAFSTAVTLFGVFSPNCRYRKPIAVPSVMFFTGAETSSRRS